MASPARKPTAGTGTPAAHFSSHAGDGSPLVQGLALGPSPAHTPIPGLGLAAGRAGSAVTTSGAMAAVVPTFPQQPPMGSATAPRGAGGITPHGPCVAEPTHEDHGADLCAFCG